jgi:DNA polymerase-3 subunit delta'
VSNLPSSEWPPHWPWIAAQRTTLLAQRGHAWLLQGPSGMGQYALGLELVRAWLCDAPTAARSVRPVRQLPRHRGAHPCRPVRADARGADDGAGLALVGKSPGRHRRQEAQAQPRNPRGSHARCGGVFAAHLARGRGKAVLVYPAEQMNHVTANALLKTLEEPPGDVRFVLASEAAHQLLPTIRSRCLGHTMTWPRPRSSMRCKNSVMTPWP